jgi:alpha-amylase
MKKISLKYTNNREALSMKKYLLMLIILLSVSIASAKKVRFSVDMTGQTVDTTGVHVAGDFQEEAGFAGGDWQPNTTVMACVSASSIYCVVVDIPAFAKYEYKFLNGDQWYNVEFVPVESRVGYNFNDNRWVYIDSLSSDTTDIRPVLFSGNAPAGRYLLRLMVDLQTEDSINDSGVHVSGDFQGWNPSSTSMYSFVDKVYEYIAYVDTALGYSEYLFLNGSTAADFEVVPVDCSVNGNRKIDVPEDTITGTVCFSSCSACLPEQVNDHPQNQAAKIYPNPCKDRAILEFNDDQAIHRVTITDLLGNVQHVYNNCAAGTQEIKCDNLKNGIYIIRIENEDQWLSTIRFIKLS